MIVNFYWDDCNLIKAYANEPFLDLANLIVLADEQSLEFKITDLSEYSFKIILENDFDINKKYRVNYQNNEYFIIPRLITHSKWFEENMLVDVDTLGSFYTKEATTFKTWAPFAEAVYLVVDNLRQPMDVKEKAIYELVLEGDFDGKAYYFEILRNGKKLKAIDPFSYGSLLNAEASVVLDKEKFIKKNYCPNTYIYSNCDAIIYEASVKDFSHDEYFDNPSSFLGLCEEGHTLDKRPIGIDYLKYLGITHLQLLPIMDFATVDEKKKDSYNWGYDPEQFNVCEGSYIVDIDNPYARVNELITLVNTLHKNDIRLNLDVVFNHVYKPKRFALNTLCPYYFFRFDGNALLSDGSYCGNEVRSEAKLMHNYILLMVKRYIEIFDIDGLRFDLMGLLDIDTIKDIEVLCKKYKKDFMLYGEGWCMPTVLNKFDQASLDNKSALDGIAFFNGRFRDVIKGLDKPNIPGFAIDNIALTNEVKDLLVGDYVSAYLKPEQSINYVECHDNLTFYDKIMKCFPKEEERVAIKKVKLALGLTILAQGIPFIHSGQEFLRTKKGLENTYNAGDEINHLDWKRAISYWGVVKYLKGLIKIRKKYAFLRLNDYEQIKRAASFENYYEVLVYNIAHLKILINPCPYRHLYQIDSEYRLIYNENGLNDILLSRVVAVPEYSIVILEKV